MYALCIKDDASSFVTFLLAQNGKTSPLYTARPVRSLLADPASADRWSVRGGEHEAGAAATALTGNVGPRGAASQPL